MSKARPKQNLEFQITKITSGSWCHTKAEICRHYISSMFTSESDEPITDIDQNIGRRNRKQ